jgi:hypothetical protein
MVGEARLTAHGSAGGALVGDAATPDVGLGVAGAVIETVDVVVVACGVFATVESPEPQPVNVAAIKTATAKPVGGSTRQSSDHTSRTVPPSDPEPRQAWPRAVTRRAGRDRALVRH